MTYELTISMVLFLLAAGAILGAAAGGAIGAAAVGTSTAVWTGIGVGALAGVGIAGVYAATRPRYYLAPYPYPVPYPQQYWTPGISSIPPVYYAPPRAPVSFYSPY